MRVRTRSALRPFIGMMLLACNPNASKSLENATRLIEGYFSAVKEGDTNRYESYYSPMLYEEVPLEKWVRLRHEWAQTLGEYQSHKLLGGEVDRVNTTRMTGTVVKMRFAVQYSKREALETFSVYEPQGDEAPKIIGHRVEWSPLASSK